MSVLATPPILGSNRPACNWQRFKDLAALMSLAPRSTRSRRRSEASSLAPSAPAVVHVRFGRLAISIDINDSRTCIAMTEPIISQQVLQFIADQIDSVPQLECLLLLHQYEARAWMPEEVAARIYISTASAQEILETLLRRGLVSAEGTPTRYRYRSSEIAGHALVADVARAYQHHLVPVATFIHSKGSASVREFARAFDLKKDR